MTQTVKTSKMEKIITQNNIKLSTYWGNICYDHCQQIIESSEARN